MCQVVNQCSCRTSPGIVPIQPIDFRGSCARPHPSFSLAAEPGRTSQPPADRAVDTASARAKALENLPRTNHLTPRCARRSACGLSTVGHSLVKCVLPPRGRHPSRNVADRRQIVIASTWSSAPVFVLSTGLHAIFGRRAPARPDRRPPRVALVLYIVTEGAAARADPMCRPRPHPARLARSCSAPLIAGRTGRGDGLPGTAPLPVAPARAPPTTRPSA